MDLKVRKCAFYFEVGGSNCKFALTKPPPADPKKKVDPRAPVVYQITPEQAAMMAVAQLRLPAVAPGIGPDPSINRWNMAAV
ncbi:MAG TPA: hypothetical protein VFP34_19205, partial [Microlunatus sp.]|nr:hypothetical protein [Microlunatus sp.]